MTYELLPALLTALDNLGLTDTMTGARAQLDRRAALDAEHRASTAEVEDQRAALTVAVARGDITLTDAAARIAANPWTRRDGEGHTPIELIHIFAVRQIEDTAVHAVRADAHDVYGQLVDRAADCVTRATTAAATVADLTPIITAVRRLVGEAEQSDAKSGRNEPPAITIGGNWAAGAAEQSLFAGLAETLKTVNPAELALDARRSAAWADAATATAEYGDVHAAAGLLRQIARRPVHDRDAADYGVPVHYRATQVIREVPAPLRIAVAAALGWRPGLYGAELFPAPERVGTTRRMLAALRPAAV